MLSLSSTTAAGTGVTEFSSTISAGRISLVANLASKQLLSMATSFSERNGKWTLNAKVRQRTGFVTIKPPRLWTSKEDAEKDVGLSFGTSLLCRSKNRSVTWS